MTLGEFRKLTADLPNSYRIYSAFELGALEDIEVDEEAKEILLYLEDL